MSYVQLSDSELTARKRHVCCECGCPIPPESAYRRQRYIFDGDPGTYKAHADCFEAVCAMNKEINSYYDDEWMPFMEHEDWKEWRGQFPHVVTRCEMSSDACSIRAYLDHAAKAETPKGKAYWEGLTRRILHGWPDDGDDV